MMVRLWVCVFMAVVLAVLHAAQPAAADKRHNSLGRSEEDDRRLHMVSTTATH